ncbi:MAG: transporter, family, multidrug resistance protein [Micromonosporaceae bacterium]
MLSRAGPDELPAGPAKHRARTAVAAPVDAAAPPLRWRAVLGTIVAAAMTVLDLTMTSSALGSIQHSLHASLDKGALVISAYATAELVTLALSAYLTRVFPPRTYLILLVSCFVAGSLLSANAWSFESLLVARVVQGMASGAIMPFAYYLIVVLMRGREHPKAISAFSLIVTGSAVLGPVLCITLAGWYSWRALYYVCIPIGAFALWLAVPGLRDRPAGSPRLGRRVSLMSVGAAVLALYCTQYVFDSGNNRGWFASPVVSVAAGAAVAMLAVFVVNELRTRHPLVDLRLLRHVPFLLTCAFNVAVGAAVYASYFLIPYYLTTLGYSVSRIGTVALYGGVVLLAVSLALPVLLRHVDVYLVSVTGAAIFAMSALVPFLAGDSPTDSEIIASQVARSVGAGLVLASLGLMVTRALTSAAAPSGSLLFNISRSLGGSIGAASCAAFVVFRETRHSAALGRDTAGPHLVDAGRMMALHDTFAMAFIVLALLTLGFVTASAVRRARHRRGNRFAGRH